MQILMKKDLKKKKHELIEIDSKYFETEKLSNEELEKAKTELDEEQRAGVGRRSNENISQMEI